MTMVFDTLAFSRRMETVGFTRQQAEALAEEQAKLIDERLATKQDLEELKLTIQHNIELLRRDLLIKLSSIVALIVSLFTALGHIWP